MMILGIHNVVGKDMVDMGPMEYMVDICIGYNHHFLVEICTRKSSVNYLKLDSSFYSIYGVGTCDGG
jgi:hypothetical protein